MAGSIALIAGVLATSPYPPASASAGTVIHVTTTVQKIGGPGGCSLQEAILAANQDSSIVFDPDGSGRQYETACEAGTGADVLHLAPGAYLLDHAIADLDNYTGPTADPFITSSILIEGHGAQLVHTGSSPFRAFAVGEQGGLQLRDIDVAGFTAQGGNGRNGGGGGLGAGGAVYVQGGSLIVLRSTFEGNGAAGGAGGTRSELSGTGGGGGGGLGGWGGGPTGSGGGGGGSWGRGGTGGSFGGGGGGGGGTVSDGGDGRFGAAASGGRACGGAGGWADILSTDYDSDGDAGACRGGGGGGGLDGGGFTGDGGGGGYGAGGGGGAFDNGDGGNGGFGGGGGAGGIYEDYLCGYCGGSGGDGGFGGGAGAGEGGKVSGGPGVPGTFGGHAAGLFGGGGAGLGGAIFASSADVTVVNSTFSGNYAVRGVAGGQGAANGGDAGGAIFTVGGSLTVNNSTISGNEGTGSGAGLVVYAPLTGEATTLDLTNTIVAGNNGRDECFVSRASGGRLTSSGSDNLAAVHPTDAETPCPGVAVSDDPQLGPLRLNPPGLTPTMAIAEASPAVDAGDVNLSPFDDQRGVRRPQGYAADIGAYELIAGDASAPTASPTQLPTANANGWNNTDVTVTWGWTDEPGGSGVQPTACQASSTSSGEGVGITLQASCADFADNLGKASYPINVDMTAPTTTIGVAPMSPDGAHGWFVSPVTVGVTATDALSSVDQTRCALDPVAPPSAFNDLPATVCAIGPVGTDGRHHVYAASVDKAGNAEALSSLEVDVDRTPPDLSPTLDPVTVYVGQTGVQAVANATDATSGVATAGCGVIDTTSAGLHSVACAATDNAGNSARTTFQYVVQYRILGFFSPLPGSKWLGGQTVPVKVALADASGLRIPDGEAAALSDACRVTLTTTGAQVQPTQCLRYDPIARQFVFNWKLGKQPLGAVSLSVAVSYPAASLTTKLTENITIVKK